MEIPHLSFPCLVCDKQLTSIGEGVVAQPNDALMCTASGNYGSTIFDPIWDSTSSQEYLSFNICDDCMTAAAKRGCVMLTTQDPPFRRQNYYTMWKP